jgi:tetratricopeptide (TPR) repeat protein
VEVKITQANLEGETVDRYTRHQLKQDEFQDTVESVQIFVSEHLKAIILIGAAVIIIVGGALWLKSYRAHQGAAANNLLQAAITTFNGYVGTPSQTSLVPADQMFPSAKAKYEKALAQFGEIVKLYPRTKAAGYAGVHMGICQARLGNEAVAIKALEAAGRQSDQEIASLAQFALAGELLRTGKLDEATKIYQKLADHPTTSVPRATALLAMADAYSATQPARAREIYTQIQKEYGSDATIAEVLKQQLASLPK